MSSNGEVVQELYHKHRPATFKQVKGQPEAVKVLETMLREERLPHTILLTGPSGCGKTTIARILKKRLGCGDPDYVEVNCAVVEGAMETVRGIQSRMGLAPVSGPCRIWLLDECQSLSRASFAQQALLKMLEDTPRHVYFFLATTDPGKILPTIKTRCTEIRLNGLHAKSMEALVQEVVEKEEATVSEEVIDLLVEVADGSARKALVLLHQILGLADDEERLQAIQRSDSKRQAIELARALMNPRSKWAEVAKILKGIDEEPESLRHMVLAYATNVLLGGGKLAPQAAMVIQSFRDNFFDSKRAGLAIASWEVISQR